jgi:glycine/D-amino acid oxidase-like deaminating enzyme
MVNVYGEIEHGPPGQMRLGEKLLQLGNRAAGRWKSFLRETNGEQVITAQDTLVVLKKGAYDFEERNFSTMALRVAEDKVGRLEPPVALRSIAGERSDLFESVLRIRGEFAMDSHWLMRHLDSVASSIGVKTVDLSVEKVLTESNEVRLVDGSLLKGALIVVAAGAFSQSLFSPEDNVLKMFQGVGTALVVPKMPQGKTAPGEVVRTVNRGGAQCGVHLVPLVGGGLYVGAGNRVSEVGEPALRFETVAYLLQTVEREFLGRSTGYLLEGNVRMGLRPRSLDGAPMIGPLRNNDKIFVATATNRAGLTWAPGIAAAVVSWADRGEMDGLFDDWLPDREPLASDSNERLLDHFVESRLGAGLEHGTVQNVPSDIARAKREIRSAGVFLLNPEGSSPPPIGTHPDNWAAASGGFGAGQDAKS